MPSVAAMMGTAPTCEQKAQAVKIVNPNSGSGRRNSTRQEMAARIASSAIDCANMLGRFAFPSVANGTGTSWNNTAAIAAARRSPHALRITG
jgi:hypothetical protein